MLYVVGVVVLHRCMVDNGGPSSLGICEFFYMLYVFGVVVLHRSMVD